MRAFDYIRPRSVEEACALLAEHGADARVIAGGQSLLNMMKLRFVAPSHLIDAGRLDQLKTVRAAEAGFSVGSMVTYAELRRGLPPRFEILDDAIDVIADLQVRNLGTLGGSCCQADAFGDMPNVVTALGGDFEAQSKRGRRRIAAQDFFRGPLETSLEPNEILIAVHFAGRPKGTGSAYEKFAWRRGDYAIVSIAAAVSIDAGGNCIDARLIAGSLGLGPIRLAAAEHAVIGAALGPDAITRAAVAAAAECSPEPDRIYGSPEYKRALVETLTFRALTRAGNRARADLGTGAAP